VIIGVHTPETEGEKNVDRVREKAKENGLEYPIVIDNDKQIWNEWDNRWWPSTYLIDKNGIARYRWDGELNWKGQKGEEQMRKKIEELLSEPGPRQAPQRKSKAAKS